MAQSENGVGISYKLADGTLVWTRRDNWAEVTEDIKSIFGEEAVARVEPQLQRAWGGSAPAPSPQTPAPVALGADAPLSGDEAVAAFEKPAFDANGNALQVCPKCGALKDKWVPPGVSQKTGKAYQGFFGCPTNRCPGR